MNAWVKNVTNTHFLLYTRNIMVESNVTSKGVIKREIKRNIQRCISFKTNCMSLKHKIIIYSLLNCHSIPGMIAAIKDN